jgi:hypothetical protein
MANGFGNAAVKEFNLALDELELNLVFLRTSMRLRPRLSGFLNRQVIQGEAETLVTSFLNLKTVESGLQYRGMLVVLSGAFEHLVRKILHEAIVAINKGFKTYDELPHKLRIQNVVRTGRALTTIGEPPDHVVVNYSELASQLATCVTGAKSFILNPEAFTLFVSSVSSGHLEDIFDVIGIKVDWDGFGREQKFETIFATRGARATGKAVAEHLDRLIKLRNRIAHSGAGGVTVTDDEVEDYIEFFRVFSVQFQKQIAAQL